MPLEQRRAVYCRLSDDDPESVSIEHQLEAAERYAEAHGLTITNVYTDWRTGRDPERLGLKQLIKDAHGGRHSGVIFYDHTRFHRALTGAYPVVVLHQQLPSYGFEATVGGYDIGKIWIWAGISGEELETTRRRTMDGRRKRAGKGELVSGKLPYWLTRDNQTRRPLLIPERAEAVRQAIVMYSNGTPMREVAQWMSSNAPGQTRWSSGRLREAFRNPGLWGELDYGRVQVVYERRGAENFVVGRTVNPKAVPFSVPLIHKTELERTQCQVDAGCDRDGHPAGETLDQLIRAQNRRAGGRPYTLEHPLRRRVVCPCGWRMGFRLKRYSDHDADFGYLICSRTKQRGVSVVKDYPYCPVRSVGTRKLWPEVQTLLIQSIRNPDRVITEVQQAILAEAAEEARSVAEEAATLENLTNKLAGLDEHETVLYEDWRVGGLISEAVYRAQTARIASQRRELEESKRHLLTPRLIVQRAERATESLRKGLAEAAELPFDQLNFDAWRRLADSLVQDVVLDAQGRPSLRWRRGV